MGDNLSRLFDDVRPRGALFDRSMLKGPWSLRGPVGVGGVLLDPGGRPMLLARYFVRQPM